MSESANASPVQPVRAPTWKRVVASILDFFTVFYLGGLAIGYVSGDATGASFQLSGVPALILFALIAVYFYAGRRHLGGTLWDRIFGIARPQPN
ncbi:MAG: hypothetical protein ACO1NY_10745 [Pseudorhodoplanes sp.]